jgi:hypothetical protein
VTAICADSYLRLTMLLRALISSPFRVAVAKSTAARTAVLAERKNFIHSTNFLGSETVNVV